jgi:hypothetical protein
MIYPCCSAGDAAFTFGYPVPNVGYITVEAKLRGKNLCDPTCDPKFIVKAAMQLAPNYTTNQTFLLDVENRRIIGLPRAIHNYREVTKAALCAVELALSGKVKMKGLEI